MHEKDQTFLFLRYDVVDCLCHLKAFTHRKAKTEEVGFEPTDGLSRQTISSRSRYDHFDTPPNLNINAIYIV